MTEVGLVGARRARIGYGFDQVSLAPSRRARDEALVDTSWGLDAYRFDVGAERLAELREVELSVVAG